MSDQTPASARPEYVIFLRQGRPVIAPLPAGAGTLPDRRDLLSEQTFGSREAAEEFLRTTEVEDIQKPLQRYVEREIYRKLEG